MWKKWRETTKTKIEQGGKWINDQRYKTKWTATQTVSQISKTRKKSSDKDGGSTDEREANQIKEKGTNRKGERKYYDYSQNDSQNESKVTGRLRSRSISKEMIKSEDKLLIAQNSLDMEQKTNKTQNVMRGICPICDRYVKPGVQRGYC